MLYIYALHTVAFIVYVTHVWRTNSHTFS